MGRQDLSGRPNISSAASTVGRVENGKMFQNQMAQCFFIGLYDIETGDDLYFFLNFFFDGWKWISKKINYYKGKMAKISPKITKIEI